MPKRVTEKDIQKVKNIRLSNFTEEQEKEYRERYEEAYEEGEIDTSLYEQTYNPPTEYDYYNSNDFIADNWYEETDNEPVQSEQEIDMWIDDIMNAILDTSAIDRPNLEVREILQSLLDNLRNQLGDREFYEYMSSNDVVTQLTEIAYEGMSTSPLKGQRAADAPGARNAIDKFARVLNMNKPLSDKQSRDLSELIETGGYIGNVNFDAFEDEL